MIRTGVLFPPNEKVPLYIYIGRLASRTKEEREEWREKKKKNEEGPPPEMSLVIANTGRARRRLFRPRKSSSFFCVDFILSHSYRWWLTELISSIDNCSIVQFGPQFITIHENWSLKIEKLSMSIDIEC